jgi:hypothetical protein
VLARRGILAQHRARSVCVCVCVCVTPSLERTASFTQSGLAKSQPVAQSIDAPSALLTLKGNTVPVDFVKDAMVDIFRKENQALRESSPKGGVAMNFAVDVFIWI